MSICFEWYWSQGNYLQHLLSRTHPPKRKKKKGFRVPHSGRHPVSGGHHGVRQHLLDGLPLAPGGPHRRRAVVAARRRLRRLRRRRRGRRPRAAGPVDPAGRQGAGHAVRGYVGNRPCHTVVPLSHHPITTEVSFLPSPSPPPQSSLLSLCDVFALCTQKLLRCYLLCIRLA